MTTTEKKTLTVMDATDVYHVADNYDWIIDCIHPETGLTWVYGRTFEDVQREYPTAERITFAEWLAEKARRQQSPIRWTRTTRAKYWEMLEILPPAAMIGGAFLVGEPDDHCASTGQPRFRAYAQQGDLYFVASRPMTLAELKREIGR